MCFCNIISFSELLRITPFCTIFFSPHLYKYIPWLSFWIFPILLLCKWILRIPCKVMVLITTHTRMIPNWKKKKKTFNPLLSLSSRFGNENVEKSAFPELSFYSLSTLIPITIIALQFSISVKVTANQFRDPINPPPSSSIFKQLLNLLNFFCFLPLFTSLLLLPQFRSHCLPTRFQK